MATLVRTDSSHPDFIHLVKLLDAYLAVIDGEEHGFYNQFNAVTHIRNVVLAVEDGIAVGCGGFKIREQEAEIKRMFVSPDMRNKGVASTILKELEKWAGELSCTKCILETGKRQSEAIHLYTKNGYHLIPNFGQYIGMDNSVCFEKQL